MAPRTSKTPSDIDLLDAMSIHPLTPIESDIVVEICRFLAMGAHNHSETADVIGILGCWGDTLPEEDILVLMRGLNARGIAGRPA